MEIVIGIVYAMISLVSTTISIVFFLPKTIVVIEKRRISDFGKNVIAVAAALISAAAITSTIDVFANMI